MGQRSRKRGRRERSEPGRAAVKEPPKTTAQPVKARTAAPTTKPAPAPKRGAEGRAARAARQPSLLDAEELSRSQRRDAEARAQLRPLAPGERPWPIQASVAIALLLGITNLILFIIGVKPHVSGTKPKLPEILVFSGLMLMCAYGMWRLRYWAVLGFQTLLAIGLLGFSLALIKVETWVWGVVGVIVIGIMGTLFWKLVRIMGRIQMPQPPRRS